MINSHTMDAVIAIGSVIRGETRHFDFVCEAVAHGVKDLNISTDTPVIFCVLTDDTLQQAKARSGGKHGNKGTEAAIAAIKMAVLGK
jgi:6,7-dimethyl-8-ribityllumazine synthase